MNVCKKQHVIGGDNVYVIRRGNGRVTRLCRRCHLDRQHAYDDRMRAKRSNRTATATAR